MEVDPRYAQYPSSLRDVYVATSGGTPAGTGVSNAPRGRSLRLNAASATTTRSESSAISSAFAAIESGTTVSATASATANNNSARNAFTNALANAGKGSTSAGAAVSTIKETLVPLAAVSHCRPGLTPLSVNHQGLFVASTISFNLQPGRSLSEAADEINSAIAQIHMPVSINGTLAGTAQLFSTIARQRARSNHHRDCRRLYPPWCSL